MKKIVIVNRRYFKSFGPTRYMLNIKSMLEKDMVEVIPFSVKRNNNFDTIYKDFFVDPPYGEDTLFFNDAKISPFQKIKILSNCIYSFEAKSKMIKLLKDTKPDLVYLLTIVNDISPSVIDACKKLNIPVVMRLSDYFMICGNYHMIKNNELCDLCVKNPLNCIKYKCVKDRVFPSLARSLSIIAHNILRIYDYIDAFICPCTFMKNALTQAGYPEEKIFKINSFISPEDYEPVQENQNYILYFGRISPEKGVKYLVEAKKYIKEKIPLYIVGDSNNKDYVNSLHDKIKNLNLKDIKFLGRKDGEELKKIIEGSKFTIIPSICPDNSPMSALESMACAKPVIASDIGGLSEQIIDSETGFLVPPRSSKILAEKIEYLWKNDNLIKKMGLYSRKHIEKNFSPDKHYNDLIKIFNNSIKKHKDQ